MLITKIAIPDGHPYGLKGIKMDRLGSVVLIAGKNGAGKSRLLHRIIGWQNDAGASAFRTLKNTKERFTPRLKAPFTEHWWENKNALAWYNTHYSPTHPLRPELYYDIEFDSEIDPSIIFFLPKQTNLTDSSNLTQQDTLNRAKAVETIGTERIEENTLARIQVIQNRWWAASHPNATASDVEKAAAITDYENLQSLITRFLHTKLTRSIDDQAELFKLPLGKAKLSDGQKILLQFCVLIHAQADRLSELIVLMDEPENHLHPSAIIEAISEIQKALSNGQLWIATHSIHLLAHFDSDSIWWMENGSIQHVGSTPEMVLKGLIGENERILKLSDFLGLPAALAANNFAHQCLLPPNVATATISDPQTHQIHSLLKNHRPSEKLRIVDFGAGRGRLASALCEDSTSKEKTTNRIDYRAYDKENAHRQECETAISRLHDTATNRYFQDESAIKSTLDPASVDIIVLCNVMHEIDPAELLDLFTKDGLLQHLLKPDGFLLIVEDMEMRVGEKAHQCGFLVLDTASLKSLFQITEAEKSFIVDDARGDGRLKAHLVPARNLKNATLDTLKITLRGIKRQSIEEIKLLRRAPANYRNGRKHAFHVQQLANATLALTAYGE